MDHKAGTVEIHGKTYKTPPGFGFGKLAANRIRQSVSPSVIRRIDKRNQARASRRAPDNPDEDSDGHNDGKFMADIREISRHHVPIGPANASAPETATAVTRKSCLPTAVEGGSSASGLRRSDDSVPQVQTVPRDTVGQQDIAEFQRCSDRSGGSPGDGLKRRLRGNFEDFKGELARALSGQDQQAPGTERYQIHDDDSIEYDSHSGRSRPSISPKPSVDADTLLERALDREVRRRTQGISPSPRDGLLSRMPSSA